MLVSFFEERNVQVAGMLLKLLNSACSEVIAGRNHDLEIVLLKEIGDFGKGGGFAHTVNSDKNDNEWFLGV